jgi:farnesyl diphosphate synthase
MLLHSGPQIRIELISGLARASGIAGLLGGQILDLAGEGRFGSRELMDLNAIRQLQSMKTGALLKFACRAGAILGGASRRERALIDAYSSALAEAFQIADDLLDVESGWQGDEARVTFVSELGIVGARERVVELLWQGRNALLPFQHLSETLLLTLSFVAERKS